MALLAALPYAMCVPFGREPEAQVGLCLRAASATAPDAALLARLAALLGLDGADVLRYADARGGQSRAIRVAPDGAGARRVEAFLLAGDVLAAGWIGELLQQRLPADGYGRALLAGSAKPPTAVPARGTQVCTCFEVTAPQIEAVLARCDGTPAAQLMQLQTALKCGTNCGSCLPQLRQRVAQQMAPA
jgi:assimilatory nitrate reductase catalytic subunit